MSALPSYLSSGASSRAHHAFLVKLHRAQSEQEEQEIIRHEVQRAKLELAVKGGASLGTIVDTLIILLHCTVHQLRAGIFEDETDEDEGPSRSNRTIGERSRGEDWALMAALQVVERAKDVRDKRIGYLYLAERLPQGHELRLMLINTIRKIGHRLHTGKEQADHAQDLESKRISHILLALGMIIKQPSSDLAPAVTPLLTSKSFLKHVEPAIRQRTLQSLMALHLPPRTSPAAITETFPLSMSKIVRLITGESDHGVLCVLLGMLRRILETQTHRVQSMQERIYLVQQISWRLGELQPDSQVAVEAVQALRYVLQAQVTFQLHEGDKEGMSLAVEELDEVLVRMVSKINDCTGLGGALVLEICSLFDIRNDPDTKLPKTLQRCLELLGTVLCPHTSSSQSTLPPANDHVFALRCLARIPLDRWEREFGTEEMGTIMRGLESGDDSVRRATLRLLRTSAPEVLNQSLKNYLTSLKNRTDLALPLHVPPESDQANKLEMALQETASRALEVVFISSEGEGRGAAAIGGICAVLDAMRGGEDDGEGEGGSGDVIWEEGLKGMLGFIRDQAPDYRSDFVQGLIRQPGARSSTFLALRASMVCSYLGSWPAVTGDLCGMLLEDLAIAEGSDLQELVLAAFIRTMSVTQPEKGTYCQLQEKLRNLMREKKLSKRIRTRIDMVLDLMAAEVMPELDKSIDGATRPEDILNAAESLWKRHRPDPEHADPSSSAHTILAGSTALPPRPISAGISPLRYGAYAAPPARSPRAGPGVIMHES